MHLPPPAVWGLVFLSYLLSDTKGFYLTTRKLQYIRAHRTTPSLGVPLVAGAEFRPALAVPILNVLNSRHCLLEPSAAPPCLTAIIMKWI